MRPKAGTIGPSVLIRGELSAAGDLTIEGQVDGRIDLGGHVLTIGPTGRTDARVLAKEVILMGTVDGAISATDTISVRDTATVDGSLAAPRVGIEEGASFRGQIDISVSIPLKKVIRRLRPVNPRMRFLKRLVVSSFSVFRPQADLGPLFGVSPRLAEATMRLHVEGDSHREQAS